MELINSYVDGGVGGGRLDGVEEDIEEHLSQPVGIGSHGCGRVRIGKLELDFLLGRLAAQSLRDARDKLFQIELDGVDRAWPGESQQVRYETLQAFGFGDHGCHHFLRIVIRRKAFLRYLGEAFDGAQRVSNLMSQSRGESTESR